MDDLTFYTDFYDGGKHGQIIDVSEMTTIVEFDDGTCKTYLNVDIIKYLLLRKPN